MSYRRPHDAHTRHEHRRDHRHDHRRDSGSYSSSHRSHASDRTSSRKRSIPDSRRISSSVPSKSPRRSHNDSKPRPRSGAETSAKREAQKQYLQKQNRFKRKEACVNLLRQIEFENKLPPIPFRPKFVFNPVVPGGPQGLATYFLPELDYQRNSLEDSKFQFPLLCGADVGCPIDFIDVASLRIPPRKPGDPDPELHPDDAALLQDEQSQLAKMREELAQQHWVQRELISENTVHSNHHHVSQVEREAKALRDAKDREERILRELNARPRAELIEEGFEFANSEDLPPHPTKGEAVKPVRSWPLVPHDGLHGRKYATMHFDHDYAKHCSLPFADAARFVPTSIHSTVATLAIQKSHILRFVVCSQFRLPFAKCEKEDQKEEDCGCPTSWDVLYPRNPNGLFAAVCGDSDIDVATH